ncbi:zinc finger protein 595-like [Ostrinia nubilalis]|uniref:zinc finger protein 595-like n=1 Tax=Ostrinia nubilalis TaxID=29057 RepID=UPI00308264EA
MTSNKQPSEEKKIKIECPKDTCRVCMCSYLAMSYIFDAGCDIVDKILYCTGLQITIDDGLPSQICSNCIQDMTIAYKFKSSCILANETYQDLLKSGIKTELDYFSDDDHFCDDDFNVKEEPDDGFKEEEITIPEKKPRKIRGPYKKKEGKQKKPRLKKFNFRRLWCEPCKVSFASRKLNDEHKRTVHGAQAETYMCEHCGKLFACKSSMYSHTRTHLPPQYACEHCDYKATYKHDLAKHLHIHAGIKLYQCQICAVRYRTSSTLNQHIRREHERVKRFRCELCTYACFDRTKYNRHMDSHNNVKRFECEVCHSCFTRRCYWKKHLQKNHNIETPRQRPGRQKDVILTG